MIAICIVLIVSVTVGLVIPAKDPATLIAWAVSLTIAAEVFARSYSTMRALVRERLKHVGRLFADVSDYIDTPQPTVMPRAVTTCFSMLLGSVGLAMLRSHSLHSSTPFGTICLLSGATAICLSVLLMILKLR